MTLCVCICLFLCLVLRDFSSITLSSDGWIPSSLNYWYYWNHSTLFGTSAQCPDHNHAFSRYYRPCGSFYLFATRMLRWFLTTTGLTAFNQPLADQDLSGLLLILVLPIQSNFNNIWYQLYANELFLCSSKSRFYVFIGGGGPGGSCSDFLSL